MTNGKLVKPKRKNGRKTYRTKRSQVNRVSKSIPPVQYGFSDIYRCKLKYAFQQTLNMNIGNSYNTSIILRANSLYDPEYAAGGGQPVYYDQLATLYNRYRVLGVKVRWTIHNEDGINCMYATILPSKNASISPVVTVLQAGQNARSTGLRTVGSEGSGKGTAVIQRYYPIAQIVQEDKTSVHNEQNFSAQVTTDPSAVGYLHLLAESSASNDITCQSLVEMEFYCQFEGKNPVIDV